MDDEYDIQAKLIVEVGEAVRAGQGVPQRIIDAGRAAFSWLDVDAELAELAHDSSLAAASVGAELRADAATVRALTFASDRTTIEIEVGPAGLAGQVVPPQPGEIDVHVQGGATQTVTVDMVGWFVVRPTPPGLFRLLLRQSDGTSVLTEWVSL